MTVREILLWLTNKDDTIDYDEVEKSLREAFIREAGVGTLTKTKRQKGQMEWKTNNNEDYHAGIYDVIPRGVK